MRYERPSTAPLHIIFRSSFTKISSSARSLLTNPPLSLILKPLFALRRKTVQTDQAGQCPEPGYLVTVVDSFIRGTVSNITVSRVFYTCGNRAISRGIFMQKNSRDSFEAVAVRVSNVGIIGNCFLALFKFSAGIIAHSGAMISDAVHSASDIFFRIRLTSAGRVPIRTFVAMSIFKMTRRSLQCGRAITKSSAASAKGLCCQCRFRTASGLLI